MNKYFLRFNISLWEFGRKNAAILRHPYPQLKKKIYSEWKKKESLNLPISSPLKSSSGEYMLTR